MSNHFNRLSLPLQKVIDLGEIDRWLRGVAELTPPQDRPNRTAIKVDAFEDADGFLLDAQNFNTHCLHFGNSHLITCGDIERMVGFRQLLTAASQQNIRLDITNHGGGHLEVCFSPAESFRASRVFGACYSNVLPIMFSRGQNAYR
ncbi:MAG: hypothetical protein RBS08_00020 [Bdellovibrionales bacterium]|jgi:hypothetical protein|nr:hypothetical protein [Bdellovibrionales bacterium]